jgi:L-aminopeptidase/D-esterase-like protein
VITDVAGVRVGHWTDVEARTGCTVVLFPAGTVASGEVRGGAPGTREFELLAPHRLITRLDAVVLTGGSAFGLAACDGVARWCEERGIGFPTKAGPVPIVVGAVLFDLATGDPSRRPGPDAGYAACVAAVDGAVSVGAVGAGTGATVNKWRGADAAVAGGIGTATARAGELVVSALVAVNAWGGLRDGAMGEEPLVWPEAPATFENTTIGVIATNALVDKTGCLLVAQSGHDGFGRALEPAHATVDGDALVAAATGVVEAPLDQVRALAARVVEAAVRGAVTASTADGAEGGGR